jgi:hypothetical protein
VAQSFREYILGRQRTYSAAGTFLEAIRKDSALLNVTSFEELDGLLRGRGVTPADREVARALWNSYEAKLRAQRGANQAPG